MDEHHFEQAAALELRLREQAIADARSLEAKAHARPDDFDGSCQGCGVDVDPRRINLGYYQCIDCANERELKARLHI